MATAPRTRRPSSAALLLLGLLALLLWGQCAALYNHSQPTVPPRPHYAVRVASLDSLSPATARAPMMLVLTLDIRNDGIRPLELYGVRGAMWYDSQPWQESEAQGRGLVIPGQGTLALVLTVPLQAEPALAVDSLLREGLFDAQKLMLRVKIDVYRDADRNHLLDQNGTLLPLPALPWGR